MSAMDAQPELDFTPEVVTGADRAAEAAAVSEDTSGVSHAGTHAGNPDYVAQPVSDPANAAAGPNKTETERLDPIPVEMVLMSGVKYDLNPLKLRQFLRLLRIITRGAADILDSTSLDFENPDQFVQQFIGMILFSVPEAEDETIDFLKSMVKPADLTGNPQKDDVILADFYRAMDNPELEDTVSIIQVIVQNEAEDLRSLGKRLGSMMKVAEKMGATKPTA